MKLNPRLIPLLIVSSCKQRISMNEIPNKSAITFSFLNSGVQPAQVANHPLAMSNPTLCFKQLSLTQVQAQSTDDNLVRSVSEVDT
jgi:hypothetical protein